VSFGNYLSPDAGSNPEYIRFALKGCLAGTICYVTYSLLGWLGIGVSAITCIIAAPVTTTTTVGSSRQRLLIRLAGLLAGGVIFGIGSQVFILPYLDSIAGFTLPFAAVCAIAAWIATSSPTLLACGRQMALAYFLTMFQGFSVNTSLTLSRDRVIGILLGLLAMWLVFDVCDWAPPRKPCRS